jgi:hypothetical protein
MLKKNYRALLLIQHEKAMYLSHNRHISCYLYQILCIL